MDLEPRSLSVASKVVIAGVLVLLLGISLLAQFGESSDLRTFSVTYQESPAAPENYGEQPDQPNQTSSPDAEEAENKDADAEGSESAQQENDSKERDLAKYKKLLRYNNGIQMLAFDYNSYRELSDSNTEDFYQFIVDSWGSAARYQESEFNSGNVWEDGADNPWLDVEMWSVSFENHLWWKGLFVQALHDDDLFIGVEDGARYLVWYWGPGAFLEAGEFDGMIAQCAAYQDGKQSRGSQADEVVCTHEYLIYDGPERGRHLFRYVFAADYETRQIEVTEITVINQAGEQIEPKGRVEELLEDLRESLVGFAYPNYETEELLRS